MTWEQEQIEQIIWERRRRVQTLGTDAAWARFERDLKCGTWFSNPKKKYEGGEE